MSRIRCSLVREMERGTMVRFSRCRESISRGCTASFQSRAGPSLKSGLIAPNTLASNAFALMKSISPRNSLEAINSSM